jgi:hypothetical protein
VNPAPRPEPGAPRRWFHSPILHFFFIGAVLFGISWRRSGGGDEATSASEAPVISAELEAALAAERRLALGREPTDAELAGARDRALESELFVREARSLGLDRSDPIVRRRLIQMMQALGEAVPEPTRGQLEAYLQSKPDAFRRPARAALDVVFIRDGADATARIQAVNAALMGGASGATLGDPHPLGPRLSSRPLAQLGRALGPGVEAWLRSTPLPSIDAGGPPGPFSPPLETSGGTCWVRVTATSPAELPRLDLIFDQVREAWLTEERRVALRRFTDRLRAKYGL